MLRQGIVLKIWKPMPALPASAVLCMLAASGFALAHAPNPDHTRNERHAHEGDLHFSHPLIAESPSPDTKLRFDYFFRDIDRQGEKAKEHMMRLEGEYAFHQSFSVEMDVPFALRDPDGESGETNLGNVEIGFKCANFAFAEHGLLLGYGIAFGLPSGDDGKKIGSDHIFEIEPFLNLGYKRGDLEVVAFTHFGIPTNQEDGEEVETELGYKLSLLYHVTPRFSGLLELDGATVLNGDEEGAGVVHITPGVKFRPFAESHLQIGAGVGLALSRGEGFDVQAVVSIFHHF